MNYEYRKAAFLSDMLKREQLSSVQRLLLYYDLS